MGNGTVIAVAAIGIGAYALMQSQSTYKYELGQLVGVETKLPDGSPYYVNLTILDRKKGFFSNQYYCSGGGYIDQAAWYNEGQLGPVF